MRIAFDETTTEEIVVKLLDAFGAAVADSPHADWIPIDQVRHSEFMTHPVFSLHRSEHRCCAT